MFFRQVIHDVAFLVDLAALDEGSLTGVASHGRMERFAAVEDVQPRQGEVQAALHQFTQQAAHYGRTFRRAFPDTRFLQFSHRRKLSCGILFRNPIR